MEIVSNGVKLTGWRLSNSKFLVREVWN